MSHIGFSRPQKDASMPNGWLEWLKWIATEDHCEWANKYVAYLKTPLGVLAMAAIASLLCGLMVAPQGYAVLAAIVVVTVVGLAWPWIAVRAISCELTFNSRRGREGQAADTRLTVHNHWPCPVWGLSIDDPLLSTKDESNPGVSLARINGWSKSNFRCEFTPQLRGEYPQQEIRISTGFPFGLYQASRPVALSDRLLVWPQTFWLPSLGGLAPRKHWRGEVSDVCVGMEGSRLGVRDHRHGDSLRDVHWAKSARYDRLIVSEREAACVEDVTVVVDVDPATHVGEGVDSSLEWGLRVAASVCQSIVAQRGRVTLWLGSQRITESGSSCDLELLLDSIATFSPAEGATAAKPFNGSRRGDASAVIFISTDLAEFHSGQSIVFRSGGFGSQPSRSPSERQGWISVESPEDVAGQVLRGWRSSTRVGMSARSNVKRSRSAG